MLQQALRISVLLSTITFAYSSQAATSWEQYKGNAQHTGFSDVTLQADATIAWQTNINGGISGLAAADGKVFISTNGYFNNQNLYALGSATGNTLWTKDFGSIFSVNPPSISNGVVYLQTGNHGSDSYFRGYDTDTGNLVVKTPFSAQWERYQSPTIYGGNAYINGGYFGGAYSYNLTTGDKRWDTGLPQYDGWTPAINDKYLVTYVDGKLIELNRNTGNIIQSIASPTFSWHGWTSTTPTLVNDNAYVVSNGYLTNFDLLNGDIDWSLSGVTSSIAVDSNEIFAVRNGAVSSINALTGGVNWLWEDSSSSNLGTDIIATNNLLIISGGSATYLLDRNTRQLLQQLNVSGQIALGNDQLYISRADGNLFAYNITAVPEPSTLSMCLLGLTGLVLTSRRRVK